MFTTAVVLTPGQTIATFQHTSQHCWPNICKLWPNSHNIWTQHIATLLGATLCMFDHPVATCCTMQTSVHVQTQHCSANLAKRLQHRTTSCSIHSCCMKNLTIFKFGPTTPNMLQHVAKFPNRVAKRAQHVAPNNVAVCCVWVCCV